MTIMFYFKINSRCYIYFIFLIMSFSYSKRRFPYDEIVSLFPLRSVVCLIDYYLACLFVTEYCHSIGVVTGLIGIGSTVQAMVSFGSACFHDLTPNSDAVSIDRTEGAALLCLIIGTGLKVFDVLLHLLVPAPDEDEETVQTAVWGIELDSEKFEKSEKTEKTEKSQKLNDVAGIKKATHTVPVVLSSPKAWEPVSVLVSDESDKAVPIPRLVKALRDHAFA